MWVWPLRKTCWFEITITFYIHFQTLPLFENGRKKPVGTVEVFVRLTSQGKMLVTQFSKPKDSDKYHYKGLNEFVPTDVQGPVKCTKCRRKRRRANNCRIRNRKPPCDMNAEQAREKGDFHTFTRSLSNLKRNAIEKRYRVPSVYFTYMWLQLRSRHIFTGFRNHYHLVTPHGFKIENVWLLYILLSLV